MADLIGRCGAVAAGLMLDRLLGDPPDAVHPVAWFGTLMSRLESTLWRDDRSAGLVHAAVGVGAAAGCGLLTARLPGGLAVSVAVACGGRSLRTAADAIGAEVLHGELDSARALLPTLVGRDPAGLDAGEISAAVVESLAENCADAVVAPVWWALLAGAPGVLAYRAVNTLDAMVGHRSERYARFGWASARIDDLANYVPARLTAILIATVGDGDVRQVWRTVRRDAGAHPSPNAGVVEAALAAVLGRELGGPLRYDGRLEARPTLGSGPRPAPPDITSARAVVDRVELTILGILAAAWLLGRSPRSRPCP